MTIKFAEDTITEFDVEKTLGTLNFLEVTPVYEWEDYIDENDDNQEKRRETDRIQEYTLKVYSSAVSGNIDITLPNTAKVEEISKEENYDAEIVLTSPTCRFWSNREIVNGRKIVSSGIKVRATNVQLAKTDTTKTKSVSKEQSKETSK